MKPLPGEITLRAASADDDEFLVRVYASTRGEELASWGWSPDQQVAFCRMQFHVRQRGYAAAFPSAETSVILAGGVPAGSMIVFRGENEIRLVDISLLPDFRVCGIGGNLIRGLISEAAGSRRALRLSVRRDNRAARLYKRLGFMATGGDPIYCEMELAAPEVPIAATVENGSLEILSDAGKAE